MCLTLITKKYPKRDKTEGYGYKIVKKNGAYFKRGVLHRGYVGPMFHSPFHINKWLKRRITILNCGGNNTQYESGFHIFRTKKDAKRHWLYNDINKREIIKIKYKGIICEGVEIFFDYTESEIEVDVLVVKQIFIEK